VQCERTWADEGGFEQGLFRPDADKVLAKGTPVAAWGIVGTPDDDNRKPVFHFRVGVAGSAVFGVRQQRRRPTLCLECPWW
jgi:hypothetical protein